MEIFLKIDGSEGESTDDRHKDEIEILSFSWGETQAAAPEHAGAAVGRVSMQDFHFTARTSKASVKLFLACANGTPQPRAFRGTDAKEFPILNRPQCSQIFTLAVTSLSAPP